MRGPPGGHSTRDSDVRAVHQMPAITRQVKTALATARSRRGLSTTKGLGMTASNHGQPANFVDPARSADSTARIVAPSSRSGLRPRLWPAAGRELPPGRDGKSPIRGPTLPRRPWPERRHRRQRSNHAHAREPFRDQRPPEEEPAAARGCCRGAVSCRTGEREVALPKSFGGVSKCLSNVLALEIRKVSEDLVDRHAVGDHRDDCGHRDPESAQRRNPAHEARVDRDPCELHDRRSYPRRG